MRPIALCLVLLCVLSGGARAGGEGVIEGSLVHKQTGEPVIGAPIKLDGEKFAVSDEAGIFFFFSLSPGQHQLEIDDPECAPFQATIDVADGQVAFRLKNDEVRRAAVGAVLGFVGCLDAFAKGFNQGLECRSMRVFGSVSRLEILLNL